MCIKPKHSLSVLATCYLTRIDNNNNNNQHHCFHQKKYWFNIQISLELKKSIFKYFCLCILLFWLCYCVSSYFLLFLLLTFFNLQLPLSSTSFITLSLFSCFSHTLFSLHSVPWWCEGDGAGSSGFSAGAPAMCPTAGPCVDPHPVPVCSAGGLWHGLSGAEEVHPQGPGSQVQGSFSFSRKRQKLFLKRAYASHSLCNLFILLVC